MKRDSSRLRAMFIGVGLVALMVYLAAGGRLGSNKGTVLIEYGAHPDAFEGLEVAIDGEPAGTLKPLGAYTRTGFAVKDGSHRVTVVGPRVVCRPRDVEVKSGATVVLMLDVGETIGADRQGRMPIVLN